MAVMASKARKRNPLDPAVVSERRSLVLDAAIDANALAGDSKRAVQVSGSLSAYKQRKLEKDRNRNRHTYDLSPETDDMIEALIDNINGMFEKSADKRPLTSQSQIVELLIRTGIVAVNHVLGREMIVGALRPSLNSYKFQMALDIPDEATLRKWLLDQSR